MPPVSYRDLIDVGCGAGRLAKESQQPVEFSDGLRFERMATLGPAGQSVCILRKA